MRGRRKKRNDYGSSEGEEREKAIGSGEGVVIIVKKKKK
jgi:hypothetical protein